MKRTIVSLSLVGLFAMVATPGHAAKDTFGTFAERSESKSTKGPRGLSVEEKVRNDHPAFIVRVDVDRADRTYTNQDLVHVTVVSEKAGYLYLLYKQANDKVVCLFPNKYQRENRISGHRKIVVPDPDGDFNLRVGPPFGTETLLAIVSLKRLTADKFGAKSFTESFATPVDADIIHKAVAVEGRQKPSGWAEHHVTIKTVSHGGGSTHGSGKRIGLFIGISDYKNSGIRDLHVCHRDAEVMYKVMKDRGRLDGGLVLTDGDATLANIRKAIKNLRNVTKPGDEVFIFWSGHGARCADDNGDEKDGFDEYLVPHDGLVGDIKTMLLDDTFGRWIQDLDGRRVVIVLDACHSGGQSTAMKGLDPPGGYFDFIDNELVRTKDIGQKDAAMLCSSDSHEISVERREGDLSVMTYFLLKRMRMLDDDRLTLRDAYKYVKVEVPAYIKKHFPRREQTPIMVNPFDRIYLRP